jgi:tetratricopeptide (TPR) repeat protein
MRLLLACFMILLAGPVLADSAKESSKPAATTLEVTPLSRAEKRSDELDQLFGQLKQRRANVEQRIWDLWVQSNSSTADLILAQATLAIRDKQYELALRMFDEMVKHYPDYAEIYNKRATLHFVMDKLDLALRDIDRVLDIEPRHFGALAGRGLILQEKGDERAALAAYREALSINPSMEGVAMVIKELEKRSPDI